MGQFILNKSMFDAFSMFTRVPIWDLSSPNMMRDYGWTRLAWCNQQKIAVYLAAIDLRNNYGIGDSIGACLGVLVLTPGTCVWADSVEFSELLSYFAAIVYSCSKGTDYFAEYATYAMAKFIDEALEEHSDSVGSLFELLDVADPVAYHAAYLVDSTEVYQAIRDHLKEPSLDGLFIRYDRMSSFDMSAVTTLELLTHEELIDKKKISLDVMPALECIIQDYRDTFLKNVEKASEKPAKKPKRTTNVRELLWNSYPHICGLCGGQINSIDEMHVDHIIPLSRGGKDILANLQLTHARCNIDKGNTLFEESEEECDT